MQLYFTFSIFLGKFYQAKTRNVSRQHQQRHTGKKRPHNVLREQERRRIFHLISKYKSWRLFAQITGQKLLTCERKMVEMTLWQNKDGRRFVIVGVERGRGSDFYISFLCRAFTFVYVDVIVRKKKSLWITKVEIRQKISRTFVYKIVLSLCLFS